MSGASSIDVLLATLNATELGSLDAIAEKMQQVQAQLESLWPRPRRRPLLRFAGGT